MGGKFSTMSVLAAPVCRLRSSAIVVRGLEKAYGDHRVIRGIDLEVRSGEVFGLLGPNGAGKTTVVEILEGYREPTSGHVDVLGFDPLSQSGPFLQRIGVVLQTSGFPRHLRVSELLDAWRGYYPHPRPRSELLEVVGLEGQEHMLVRRLSGGQQRRLDFALALAGDPDLIFLDEPTTGFDPEARRRCWSAIENLKALGKTVLLTTHYLDEAERLADRLAVLADGRIRALGTRQELVNDSGAPVRISFAAPEPFSRPLPTPPQGVDICVEDGRVVTFTRDPSWMLGRLLDWSRRHNAVLHDLAVDRPRLEDVYLSLVGGRDGEEVAV